MIEGVHAAKRVIVVAEEVVAPEVIARKRPNRTAVIPGFLVNSGGRMRVWAHPSPVQGYYKRDDAFFGNITEGTRKRRLIQKSVVRALGVAERATGAYMNQLGACRVDELKVKQHAYMQRRPILDIGYLASSSKSQSHKIRL